MRYSIIKDGGRSLVWDSDENKMYEKNEGFDSFNLTTISIEMLNKFNPNAKLQKQTNQSPL